MDGQDKRHDTVVPTADAGQALRQRAEAIAAGDAAAAANRLAAMSPEEARRIVHELRVHQIELEMQNEELRRAQLELDVGRARYFDLYDLAPVGYCTLSETGLILEANLTAATLLGLARSALVKRPISHFIVKTDQDTYYLHRKQLLASGEAQSCELRMVTHGGMQFWAQLVATAARSSNGEPVHRVVLSDITDRKLMAAAMRESEDRYRALVEWSPEAVGVHSGGKLLYVNPAAVKMFGASAAHELVGKAILNFVHPDFHHIATARVTKVAEYGLGGPMVEEKLLKLDGTIMDAEVQNTSIIYDGQPAIHVAIRDVTQHKRTQAQLLASQALLRESALRNQTILDNMVDGVITINAQGLMETFNKAASTIFGYALDEVMGHNVTMLMPAPLRSPHDGYLQNFKTTDEARFIGQGRELEGQRRDGSVFPMSLSVSGITRQGQPVFIGIVRDITQHRQDMEKIRQLAFYDPLTGLPNRRLLLDRVEQGILASKRKGQHGALMFLDLDHFKRLNDTLGHDVGDVLLQQVASRLKACVREGDSVGRLGGDEFVVLLEALSAHAHEAVPQAEAVASQILNALGQPYNLLGHPHASTPSIGIVVFMDNDETTDELLKKADLAMYQAKSAGRNTVRFYDAAVPAAVHTEIEKSTRQDDQPRAPDITVG
jgi:diguanylate cyclase (GGDEF)-like protein/PAS domain S-box-containing protein